MRLFIQLKWYFFREWHRYCGAVSLLVVTAVLQLLPPYIVGILVDGVMKRTITSKQVMIWVGGILVIAMIVYWLRYFWRILLFGASYLLAVELRKRFYLHLSHQTPGFYLRYRTGDLLARVTNDIDRVVFAAGEGVLTLVDALTIGLAVLIVMSTQISWQLTLLALLPMPLMVWVIKYFGQQLHQRFQGAQAAFSSLNNQAQESLSSIRMVKVFGLEKYQTQRFARVVREAGIQNMHVAKVDAGFEPVIYLAVGCANFLALAGGGWMVVQGRLTLGELTSFVMYLGLMVWPMLALAWMLNIVERGSAAYRRILSVLVEPFFLKEGKCTLPAHSGTLQIDIDTFFYQKGPDPNLAGIHVTLRPGQVLGLCGPIGCGKSTLLALIQRQFDPDEGAILYHGVPLTQLSLDKWRSRLVVVTQLPFLFSDTVAMNIALGKPSATQWEIEKAAQLACVHEDILRLPEGYATEVGERGVMLSGGQKQRIAIARALLLSAEIVILDDALSAVDSDTEQQIMQNLFEWGKNRTFIISAHRLSVLSRADEILVIQQGHIIQRGQDIHLRQQPGWYRDMIFFQQVEAQLTDPRQPPVSKIPYG